MKVFLFVSKQKKLYKMYMPYLDALNKQLDIVKQMADADIVLIVGAWTIKGAQLARQARKMGIPYIVCPLGDISERNCKNPHFKRSLQTLMYQKKMYQKANLLIATTPMEKTYLEKKAWNTNISLIRYFGYSHLTSENNMAEDWYHADTSTLSIFEQHKAEAIAAQTKDAINEELAKQKLSDYAASVFQAMTEKTGFTEGFMPQPAKKGRKSEEILKKKKKK